MPGTADGREPNPDNSAPEWWHQRLAVLSPRSRSISRDIRSPRRRRSGVNRHSSSRPVGTGDAPMALLIGMPSGDLSGPGQRAGCGAWCRWLGYGVTCSANRDNAAPWRPPSFPPGQPGHLEDPDSTIHVLKTVTMIAEDDPYRLVTCGSVVMAAGGRLHRPRVRSQAARRARLCGHGRHGGFRADRGGRPRLDAAQLTYRVVFGVGAQVQLHGVIGGSS
jgi:hypothetical protein